MLIVEHLLGKRCCDVLVAISENKSLETAAPLGCSSCNPVITLACDMTHGICVKPTSHPPLLRPADGETMTAKPRGSRVCLKSSASGFTVAGRRSVSFWDYNIWRRGGGRERETDNVRD